MTRIAVDSNILVYLAGIACNRDDSGKIASVRSHIARLADISSFVAPVQALGELFVVLCRSGVGAAEARDILLDFTETFEAPVNEARTATAAADLVVDHKLQYWDALVVTAAADAGCTLLLSEDMQHGFVTRGLTIVNPLAEPPHSKLAALLAID